ncbi:hypothetical protein TIFTF001_024906 [Ficus carica]|uniref:V-type proton ATPase proteolipid subunit n=1 Tax=Ficus carica TaxID=3494 RepID=A0AA88B0Z7_FICCA|nr:hypothetical protein TIFTF001_024906 [Ficus carica]
MDKLHGLSKRRVRISNDNLARAHEDISREGEKAMTVDLSQAGGYLQAFRSLEVLFVRDLKKVRDNECDKFKPELAFPHHVWIQNFQREREREREREIEPPKALCEEPTSSRILLPPTMSSTFSGDETAPFFGFLGAAAALVFSCMGAAYGTAKSGVGVASMGVMRPELVMKSIVPVVMAGVLGIYGLIIAVIISTGINPKAKSYYLFDGYAHLSSGLACGLAGLSAGMAIGIVGDAGVRANAQQPKLFVGMILILIFAEALALYGLIVGIILSSRAGQSRAE